MKKISACLAFVCLLLLASPSYSYIAILVTSTDINPSLTAYNYEIRSDCFGFCLDTVGGVPVEDAYRTDEFYLPYFPDAGISDITSPSGWSYSLELTNDLFGLGHSAGVIHWVASEGNELDLYASLSGFEYTSTFTSSVKAPFILGYVNGTYFEGDPPIPASPSAIAAGLSPIPSQVPIPASVWLFVSGLFGFPTLVKSRLLT